jgi:thiol-disulfide isomerase/thioredoxin
MKKLLAFAVMIGVLVYSLPVWANGELKTCLRGAVPNAEGTSLSLLRRGHSMQVQAEAAVINGRFNIETVLKKPGFFVFTSSHPLIKEFDVYLNPGDDITLSVENGQVSMSGKGSQLNQFLFGIARKYDYSTNPSAVEVYQARVNAINASAIKEVLRVKAILLGYAQGEFLDKLYGPVLEAKGFGSSDEIKEPTLTVDEMVMLPGIVHFYNWRETLTELLFAKMQAGKLKVRNMTTWVADFAGAINNQELREDYIVEQLKYSVSQGDLVSINEVMAEALPLVKDPGKIEKIRWLKALIARGMNLYKNALPGTDLSAFSFLRPDSTELSLSAFKGKFVFIDIWSTWCTPCKAEIPFLKRLEKEFHGQDIVFVSISIDKNPGLWKSYMAKRAMDGEQLITKSYNKDPFSIKIGLAGIPRFIILDKEGRVVNYNCCQRPSNPLLKTYLTEILNK